MAREMCGIQDRKEMVRRLGDAQNRPNVKNGREVEIHNKKIPAPIKLQRIPVRLWLRTRPTRKSEPMWNKI